MAYIGQDPVIGRYILVDQISGGFNGTASGFTLAAGGQGVIPGLAQNVLLSLGGVIQQPGTDYTVSGSGITFTTPPLSGTTFFATVLGDVQAVGTPSDGTVLPASIATSGTFVFPNITTTGTTLIASGNASTPSLAVIGDTNTGLYSPGADQLSITTGGTERFRIDSAGQLEAVSLGTAAAPTFSFTTDPNTGIYSPGADQLAISTNGTGRLYVDATGRVGIGTSAPSSWTNASPALVVVNSNTTAYSATSFAASPNLILAGGSVSGAYNAIRFTGTGANEVSFGVVQEAGGAGAFVFQGYSGTAYSERLRIDSSGRVGIGTTSPSYLVTAATSADGVDGVSVESPSVNGVIRLRADGTNGNAIRVGGVGAQGNTLRFLVGSDAERMRIDSSGRLLVGTSSVIGNNHWGTVFKQQLSDDTAGTAAQVTYSSTGVDYYSSLELMRARGSASSPASVSDGDFLGAINFYGYNSSGSTTNN